ncbi:MAG: ferric iron uptake transcriptional regulator [Ottowia sp.]|nr:ferric iron uptake transcriptional regulator [Ottowia sp.]
MDTITEIKSSGLKATLPRLKILDIFQRAEQRHMTAEDVYRHLLAEDTDIGLATVYRVLSQFEQAGLLSRSHFDTTKAIYELSDGAHHDHLVCLDCGTVLEFHDAAIERQQEEVATARGFTLEDHSLSLYARCNRDNCPNCPQRSQ